MAVNTDATLVMDVVMPTIMEEFSKTLLPLSVFSTAFSDVPIQYGKEALVPYYPLVSAASSDFDYGTGYTSADYTVSERSVPVNKRKFQSLGIRGEDIARKPVADIERIMRAKARKLAADVLTDIFSVITTANFPNETGELTDATFDADDLTDVWKQAQALNWPATERAAVLRSSFYAKLFPFEDKFNESQTTDARREAVVRRLRGFDIYATEAIPAAVTPQFLEGFFAYPSAILVAFAPIPPPPGIKDTVYGTYTDPKETGLTLEFREISDGMHDTVIQVVECNYGFAVGEEDALIRLVSDNP